MATREVSPSNLGGIIMISQVSYEVSGMGWAKLLFFLCILSVNLAVLNVLPIPLLDGGHIFFVLVEADSTPHHDGEIVAEELFVFCKGTGNEHSPNALNWRSCTPTIVG